MAIFSTCEGHISAFFRLQLNQGDAMFMNNRTTLHARTKFVNGDGEGSQRHLMRLWLDVPGKRRDVPEIQLYDNEGGRSGIDPQLGHVRAGAQYRTMTMTGTGAK